MTRAPRRAGAALVGAAVLLLAAGAVLATVARPVESLTASTRSSAGSSAGSASAPLLVVAPALLRSHPGPVVVRASGTGPVLVAAGRADDVTAWAEGAATTTATAAGSDGAVATSSAAGDAQVPDPAGSDLWTAQARGTGSAQLRVDPAGGATAVLVASDGSGPAPTALQLTWSHRPVPLAAWGLLGAGAALVAVLLVRRARTRVVRTPVVVDLRERAPVPEPELWGDPEPEPEPEPATAGAAEAPLQRPRGRRRSQR